MIFRVDAGLLIAPKMLPERVLTSKFSAFDARGSKCDGTFWIFFRMACHCGR
jgi:hypothetical protein